MIGKPKELWKSLESLYVPNKAVISNFNAIGHSNISTHDTWSISKIFMSRHKSFVSDEKLLRIYQSSFRVNHSTNLCLSFLTGKILKGLDESLLIGMILIHLQKAFGTMDHESFLQKIKTIRFLMETITWFRSYLSE